MSHTPPSRINQLNRGVTEGRVAELVTAGVIAAATNIYAQLTEQNRRMLLEMEDNVVTRVLHELETRTWRWRVARWSERTLSAMRGTRNLTPTPPTPPIAAAQPVDGPELDEAERAIEDKVQKGIIEVVRR